MECIELLITYNETTQSSQRIILEFSARKNERYHAKLAKDNLSVLCVKNSAFSARKKRRKVIQTNVIDRATTHHFFISPEQFMYSVDRIG